jgi:hypothetical protein
MIVQAADESVVLYANASSVRRSQKGKCRLGWRITQVQNCKRLDKIYWLTNTKDISENLVW